MKHVCIQYLQQTPPTDTVTLKHIGTQADLIFKMRGLILLCLTGFILEAARTTSPPTEKTATKTKWVLKRK